MIKQTVWDAMHTEQINLVDVKVNSLTNCNTIIIDLCLPFSLCLLIQQQHQLFRGEHQMVYSLIQMFKHQYNLKASSRSYTHASSLTLDGTLFFPPILDTHNDSSTYYLSSHPCLSLSESAYLFTVHLIY